jgi:hypothetical protein
VVKGLARVQHPVESHVDFMHHVTCEDTLEEKDIWACVMAASTDGQSLDEKLKAAWEKLLSSTEYQNCPCCKAGNVKAEPKTKLKKGPKSEPKLE